MPKPLLYFAFANNRRIPEAYLKELKKERIALSKLLGSSKAWNLRMHAEAGVNLIRDIFRNFEEELLIFHYSGHASKDRIILESEEEDPEIAFSWGVASLVKNCKQIKFVFLNGCCTAGQIEAFRAAKVPVVIATQRPIEDAVAREFAEHFYTHLLNGRTLRFAFEEANRDLLLTRKPEDLYRTRGFKLIGVTSDLNQPYTLYIHESFSEIADESLFDWVEEPEKEDEKDFKPIHEKVYLLCNRKKEERQMRLFLEKNMDKKRPNFFLVHGAESEKPEKLVERFYTYTLKKVLADLGKTSKGASRPIKIDFPQQAELIQEEKQPGFFWEVLEANFRANVRASQGKKFSPSWVVRSLGRKKELLLIQHELFSTRWHEAQCRYIEQYISQFWDYAYGPKDPLVVVIFNLTYIEPTGIFARFKRTDQSKEAGFKALADSLPNCWLVPRLEEVAREDVIQWQRDYLSEPEYTGWVDNLFKKRQTMPMKELIGPLKAAIDLKLQGKG